MNIFRTLGFANRVAGIKKKNRKKFEGVLLISDLDGTLMADDKTIPHKNRDGILYFLSQGGTFTIATGRSHLSLMDKIQMMHVNAPCIVMNGCGIYDYSENDFLYETYLSEMAKKAVRLICLEFPQAVPVVFTKYGMHTPLSNFELGSCFDTPTVPLHITDLDDIEDQWSKVVFIGEHEMLTSLMEYTNQIDTSESNSTFSGDDMVELLPAGTSKGSAMIQLVDRLGIPLSRTAAIGDHFNDLEMLELAAISAATGQAPEALKKRATHTVSPCNDGSVGDFIELLDRYFR